MKTKVLIISAVAALTLAALSGVAVAANSITVSQKTSTISSLSDNSNDMIKLMRDNGFTEAANHMQAGNYKAMGTYMNNLSDENYNKMIDIMRQNGYSSMAQMMESIGKDGMTQMHNSMMGTEGG